MTPLAGQLMRMPKEYFVTSTWGRGIYGKDYAGNRFGDVEAKALREQLYQAHCFEYSEVAKQVGALAERLHDGEAISERLRFLPAPICWMETGGRACRSALLLIAQGNGTARVVWVKEDQVPEDKYGDRWRWGHSASVMGNIRIFEGPEAPSKDRFPIADEEKFVAELPLALLALINTPRVVMREQRMPHAGLQRRLARERGMVGKFPLRAWTELKLKIGAPEVHSGKPIEAMLTGRRCLHFCRMHLRLRCGHLELVKAHWRGEAALGIKQTRYRLQPPGPETKSNDA